MFPDHLCPGPKQKLKCVSQCIKTIFEKYHINKLKKKNWNSTSLKNYSKYKIIKKNPRPLEKFRKNNFFIKFYQVPVTSSGKSSPKNLKFIPTGRVRHFKVLKMPNLFHLIIFYLINTKFVNSTTFSDIKGFKYYSRFSIFEKNNRKIFFVFYNKKSSKFFHFEIYRGGTSNFSVQNYYNVFL